MLRQGSPEYSRRAHHERKKVNKFNTTTVHPDPSASLGTKSLVEVQLPGVLDAPYITLNIVWEYFTVASDG